MDNNDQSLALLREILENLSKPENLIHHPWLKSRMVADSRRRNLELGKNPPGVQLIQTISDLFCKMIPNLPPKHGVRLDNRWGEFGILAAQYFAPLLFNYPFPASLREAWQGIDHAILLFVFGEKKEINEDDLNRYRLIGNEPEIAPNSTISDWHRKGLEQFAQFITQYEKQLETKHETEGGNTRQAPKYSKLVSNLKPKRLFFIWIGRITAILLVGLLAIGIWKGLDLFQKARSVKSQVENLFAIYQSSPTLDEFQEISQRVSKLRKDLELLKAETSLLLKMSPYFNWVPVYGNDLNQASFIMEMAVQMSIAGDEVLSAIGPMISSYKDNPSPNILSLLSELKDSETQLFAAQVAIADVKAARLQIQTKNLSPVLNNLIINKVDPLLNSIDSAFPVSDLLQMARLIPRLLGVGGNGSQTYMILIQNEDELRPTGGFLTAVGLMKIEDGKISSLNFESSDLVDDLSKSYPRAPWQLDEYMKSEILLFRDANWFTNFPTTVEWAKFLYSYTRTNKVDGVITLDQHVIEELLQIVGPIKVVGVDQQISADNVLSYMRTAKENTPPRGVSPSEWNRKQFISWLAEPMIKKLLSGDSQIWPPLLRVIIQLLDEKHILLQFDDPEMNSLVIKRGWDGSVQPLPGSDFLMVVDSNIGFNKTSARMKTSLEYVVNLADLNHPIGNLTVSFTNNTEINNRTSQDCIQAGGEIKNLPLDQRKYIMDDCYWTYLRIYSPIGSQLVYSTPHEIPKKWPLREKIYPAQTDILDEKIFGTQVFGTLLVIPKAQTLQTLYSYQLPSMVVSKATDGKTYQYIFKIQKQPGTQDIPLTFHLILPTGMIINNPPIGFQELQKEWILYINLNKDTQILINFYPVG
jgi:hypothetical protein